VSRDEREEVNKEHRELAEEQDIDRTREETYIRNERRELVSLSVLGSSFGLWSGDLWFNKEERTQTERFGQ